MYPFTVPPAAGDNHDMPDPIYIHDGRHMTADQYATATGRRPPRAPAARSLPTAATRPVTISSEAATEAERRRISQILALPLAATNRKGAEGLAFGSSATVAEAATALARAADKKAGAREALLDNMRAKCGVPLKNPNPLTAGAISMLKIAANQGPPEQRKDAIAKLAEHGLNAQGR